ncbi:MAG: hypothetical protein WCC17_18265 [Candidatus Nitrosopolaris sp.]
MPISLQPIHTSMNPKIIMPFSTMAIAAVALLFASGPIVASQQALAFVVVHGGYGFHHFHHFFHPYFHRHFFHPYFHRHFSAY